MADNTPIEWCDHTFNPWEGCQKVSPGCDNCYAEARNARYNGTAINWGTGAPRRRTSEANWKKPLKWQKDAATFFEQHGRRQRVFCASLADVFDNAVDPEWRSDLFNLIRATPDLDWLLLTKRIGNVPQMVADTGCVLMPGNVWLGISVVNQEEADRDIPKLLATDASIRFLSMEPLLGPVDLTKLRPDGINFTLNALTGQGEHLLGMKGQTKKIDWVIVGGESGANARPLHPHCVISLRDQCAAAGTPFLFKQWGEHVPVHAHGVTPDGVAFRRIGKKAAGRTLQGVEHNGFPEVLL